ADERYPEIYGGELAAGRWFTHMEVERGTPVVVLSTGVATTLFGNIQPIDKLVHVGGRPARVIGVYQSEKNIFEPPGQQTHAIIPYKMMDHQFWIDRTNALFIPVKPRTGVTVADAENAVTVLLREMRHLGPADHNTFDLITQDQIL